MAIIDVVKWDAPSGVFAWKFPSSELSSWTQLVVHESQEALMFKEGQSVGPFSAGRHTLSSDNYPILNSLLKIPFGRSPYTAEVWFVQRAFKLNIPRGTTTPLQLEDPKYKVMLPVRAFGQYGITVDDTQKFLIKLVGTLPAFTEKTLVEYFKGIIVTRTKDLIAKYLVERQISILHIGANLNDISATLEKTISEEIEEYGLKITRFNVNSISTDDKDSAVVKLKEALAKRAEMEILGYNYQQMRSFDTMETAAGNTGGGGAGVMGAGIGMGMGMGMGVPMGQAMGGLATNLNVSGVPCPKCRHTNDAAARFCSKCGVEMAATKPEEKATPTTTKCSQCGHLSPLGKKFCPECGDVFSLCPKCSADNPTEAAICAACGEALPIPCPGCGAKIAGGLKFCSECGKQLGAKCPGCNESIPQGKKFCANCGTKIEGV